ncbi:hypothetical protein DUI87_17454 [Hirundo rustica rustica]|uniref:PPM-type phosphatase domain-containing protein n=1 Tax=Hirundo rustica rustica TaxID=333673 RepID=A0A3M0JYC5_HIRRU|nr:hypothetical protein DUI87_17454 [Hirundo rustica rustica]
MALELEPSAAPLSSFLRDFPAPLGPGEPLPWSSAGSGALSRPEVPGALAERARSLLGSSRDVSPLLAASLIHAAVEEVLQTDLTEFKLQNVETEGEGDEESFTLLDGESLQRCFFNKLRDVCSKWQKQLPPLRPLTRFLLVSIHAIRNARRKMEDRHVLLPEFNQLFGLSKLRSGTTGVSALIVGNKLHIAWLGDSQVMLVQQGKGCDINGTSQTRTRSDICQKPYVSGDADGDSFELTGSEDYLLLACDGFFDAIKPHEVVDLVLDHLMQTEGVGLKAAERLVAAAKANGSSDNITVLVVFLRDPQDILADCLRDSKSPRADGDAQSSPFNFLSCEAAGTQ